MSFEGPEWEAFFTVHRDLPREGPGDAQSVLWALELAGTPPAARIADLGCGPGADAAVLMQMRPEASLLGIDAVPHFVEAAARRVPEAEFRVGDMAQIEGPFDLIWSAGAIYFLGVTEGLSAWKPALAPGGRVVFSEPVLLSKTPSQAATEFWAQYPQITDLEGIEARITAAGYRVVDHKLIVGAPWKAYFEPMEARLDILEEGEVDAYLAKAISENRREIALWKAAPDEIAYALFVVAPE
ncbi:MAG: class I SAM-dependent methyltransferase [Dinoroseobacter sp.]|nr:class I SAM-dependent methyltransferase [Dinoroseobacter sp.]